MTANPTGHAPTVAVEGLDGSGKTTQCRLLAERLRGEGRAVQLLPLFRFDLVEQMLDDLDRVLEVPDVGSRYAVVAKVLSRQEWLVGPSGAAGTVTVYDKFLLTFFAHELRRGAGREELAAMVGRVEPPDVTLVLELGADQALRRKEGRVGFREAGLNLAAYQGEPVSYARYAAGGYPPEFLAERYVAFQDEVRAEFDRLLGQPPAAFGRKIVPIRADRPVDEVAADVWSAASAVL